MTDQLAEPQLLTFDREYVDGRRWRPIEAGLSARRPNFSFLDVGGGNGTFADLVLRSFPEACGTVGDNARVLLDRNAPGARKTVRELDALALPAGGLGPFDVVFLHWVLHHVVATGDGGRSRHHAVQVLRDVRPLLGPDGRVSVYENLYDGALVDDLPGRLIFRVTSMKRLAPLTRRLGANTAGVGVCFRSELAWRAVFAEAGYDVEAATPAPPRTVPVAQRVALTIKSVRSGHFWLRPR